MFLFFPVGVEEAEVNRLPWVSITLAVVCVVAFLATWVVPEDPTGLEHPALGRALEYAVGHPYLTVPAELERRVLPPEVAAELSRLRVAALEQAPATEVMEREQRELEAFAAEALASLERSPMRRFSLVPERGLFQRGFFSHMFLHFGWFHLLSNLFFFYLVGPLLEDIWGRRVFLGFYLLGGLAAGLAHYLLEPSSGVMMAGASGAVAACMGAFAFRYAARKVRIGYLLFLFIPPIFKHGTVRIAAWLCGLLWFGNELLSFTATGGNSGVAVMAHMGGFGFGSAVALGLKVSGIESGILAPAVERSFTWQQHPAIQEGIEAEARGDPAAATAAFARALAEAPESLDARFHLASLEVRQGNAEAGPRRLRGVFSKLFQSGREEEVARMVGELGAALLPSGFPPAMAFQVGVALESHEGGRQLAEGWFAHAGTAGGTLGVKALLKAAQLRLDVHGPPQGALGYLERARAVTPFPAELEESAVELETRAQRASVAAGGIVLEGLSLPQAPALPAPKVIPCAVVSLTEAEVVVRNAAGQQKRLAFRELVGVAVAQTSATAESAPGTLWVDLIVSFGDEARGAIVLRARQDRLGLERLFPGISTSTAVSQLVGRVLDRSEATALPDLPSLRAGRYPSFASVEELERAFYGAAASRAA